MSYLICYNPPLFFFFNPCYVGFNPITKLVHVKLYSSRKLGFYKIMYIPINYGYVVAYVIPLRSLIWNFEFVPAGHTWQHLCKHLMINSEFSRSSLSTYSHGAHPTFFPQISVIVHSFIIDIVNKYSKILS